MPNLWLWLERLLVAGFRFTAQRPTSHWQEELSRGGGSQFSPAYRGVPQEVLARSPRQSQAAQIDCQRLYRPELPTRASPFQTHQSLQPSPISNRSDLQPPPTMLRIEWGWGRDSGTLLAILSYKCGYHPSEPPWAGSSTLEYFAVPALHSYPLLPDLLASFLLSPSVSSTPQHAPTVPRTPDPILYWLPQASTIGRPMALTMRWPVPGALRCRRLPNRGRPLLLPELASLAHVPVGLDNCDPPQGRADYPLRAASPSPSPWLSPPRTICPLGGRWGWSLHT